MWFEDKQIAVQNDLFDSEEDTILDFTESNPFGDAGK